MKTDRKASYALYSTDSKNQKSTRGLALLLSLILVLSTAAFWPAGQAEAAGTTIDATKLKSISRLYFPMRDEKKQLYTLYLFATDEKKTLTTQEGAWAGANVGDVVYSGTYRAALLKHGQKTGSVQNINLNFDFFNATRNESFRLPGDGKNRPDLLFLSEAASSNVNLIRGFAITGGTLHSLSIADGNGKVWGKETAAAQKNAMRGLSGDRIQTRVYDNSSGRYRFDIYKLDLKQLKLRHIDDLYAPSNAWPTGQGSHALLDSIKQSALKHVLRDKPQVKIGMTEKQVRSIMGSPKTVENGEWGGYFGYGNLWVGFNDYMNQGKIPAHARVGELTTQLNGTFMRTHQVKEWLGAPKEEYEDDLEGGYAMIYRWNNASLVFRYEYDGGPIHSFSIH
ncbi:hypothetical protein [Saccharibacillus sacchari]|uniref:Uncharacterized protein n=1 Tax=Saccharibacillus sacchari TaxID=456493 RepID=A0ACC6PIR4_9BACL